MHHTGEKESKKRFLKNNNKKKGCEKFTLRGFEHPQNQLELKVNAFIHWTTSGNADNLKDDEIKRGMYSFSMVIDSFKDDFFVLFCFVLFLFPCRIIVLIEARREAHNKAINTLAGLVPDAGERLRNL